MHVFIIIAILFIVGYVTYAYKVILDLCKHTEDVLIQHEIELAKVHYCLKGGNMDDFG